MNQKTKDWVKLIALVFGTGAGVTVTSALGGAKVWIAVLCGLGAAGMNVYHALASAPGEKSEENNSDKTKL